MWSIKQMTGFIFGALLFGLPPKLQLCIFFSHGDMLLISCFSHRHLMLEGAAHLAISPTVDFSATEY
jgi:hypothetical protein